MPVLQEYMIKKVVSDLKVRYYILVIPLPEKGVKLGLRFKKYVYVTLMTSTMWLLLLYFIKPSGWTILFSIVYLLIMTSWYFNPDQSGESGPTCVGLTFNYAALLVSVSILVLRLIFNFWMGRHNLWIYCYCYCFHLRICSFDV